MIFKNFFNKIKKLFKKEDSFQPIKIITTQVNHYEFHKVLDTRRIKFVDDSTKDGIIFIRKGVPDLDLNGKIYAKIRLLTDENKIIKGMAIYSDDIPDGKDVVVHFCPNKKFSQTVVPLDISRINVTVLDDGVDSCIFDMSSKIDYNWNAWKQSLSTQYLSKHDDNVIIVERRCE